MNKLEQSLIAQAAQNLTVITRLICATTNDNERREFSEAWGAFYATVELSLHNSGLSETAALQLNALQRECSDAIARAQSTRTVSVEDEIQRLLASPATSHWLKQSLESALLRDCVEAANDANLLCDLLTARCENEIADTASLNVDFRFQDGRAESVDISKAVHILELGDFAPKV
jgi:hypothetical protein